MPPYTKDFDGWHPRKKQVEASAERPYYKPREIWWCALGVNVGDEQDGTGKDFDRPVLILRGFNKNVFFGAALTGKRRDDRFHVPLGKLVEDDDRESSVILSQVRLIDTKRLLRKVCTLEEPLFEAVRERIKQTLFG